MFNSLHLLPARVNDYLLEKSRVVQRGAGEANFHLFYFLVAGVPVDKRNQLCLSDPENYR